MSKCWYIAIAGLVLSFSVLWPYFFTSNTDREKELQKELGDKGQQIIKLLNQRIDAQKEIAELKDTIRSFSSSGINTKCIEGLECTLVVKDYERKVGKLEDDIKLLQGQVNANTKEFTTCQQLLDDCNACSHISSERSNDRFYYIIICGILALLCGGCCCCGFLSNMAEKHKNEKERYQQEEHARQLQILQQQQQQQQQQRQQAIMAKRQSQSKGN